MSSDDLHYHALSARDPRFDGLFFVGVSSTGIYCRPVCPARLPARKNCSFYPSAAQAELAGYRACFRCRPELSPGAALIDRTQTLVDRAVVRINAGALNEGTVADLAAGLGVGERHLRRSMSEQLGTTPVGLAQSRRLALAKQLLTDTDLGLTAIAHASGFGSVRRFNSVFQTRLGRAPSSLRARARADAAEVTAGSGPEDSALGLRLDYRPPFSFKQLLGFLKPRAIPGVEHVTDDLYARSVRAGNTVGCILVESFPGKNALRLSLSGSLLPSLIQVLYRARHLFDLDAQPEAICRSLTQDPTLAPLCRAAPGLRVPGAFDGFETSVRALLGQQISVKGATTLAGRLVARFGQPLALPMTSCGARASARASASAALTHVFPDAGELARVPLASLAAIGLPERRAAAILAFAEAVAAGELHLGPGADPEAIARRLLALPGVGPWTAGYIAMRALHDPDAFPHRDLVLRKVVSAPSFGALSARAEAWRPWRAYAALHLWTAASTAAPQPSRRQI